MEAAIGLQGCFHTQDLPHDFLSTMSTSQESSVVLAAGRGLMSPVQGRSAWRAANRQPTLTSPSSGDRRSHSALKDWKKVGRRHRDIPWLLLASASIPINEATWCTPGSWWEGPWVSLCMKGGEGRQRGCSSEWQVGERPTGNCTRFRHLGVTVYRWCGMSLPRTLLPYDRRVWAGFSWLCWMWTRQKLPGRLGPVWTHYTGFAQVLSGQVMTAPERLEHPSQNQKNISKKIFSSLHNSVIPAS